jgi:hypothetical protein
MRTKTPSCIANGAQVSAEAVLYQYIERSIERLMLGRVKSEDGSWLEGILGKAARKYEQWARGELHHLLQVHHLDYDTSFRDEVPGKPKVDKLTLGQIVSCFKRIPTFVASTALQGAFNTGSEYSAFCIRMDRVNATWKECVKHGHKNLSVTEALEQLRNMKTTIEDMRTAHGEE